jgi:hypothetical protein
MPEYSSKVVNKEMQIKSIIRYYKAFIGMDNIYLNTKHRQGHSETGSLISCLWEGKMLQLLWKTDSATEN